MTKQTKNDVVIKEPPKNSNLDSQTNQERSALCLISRSFFPAKMLQLLPEKRRVHSARSGLKSL